MTETGDAELLRLDAEFKAAYAAMDAAADRVEELEGLFQNTGHRHFHDDMLAAELKQDRLTEAADGPGARNSGHARQHAGRDDGQAAGERYMTRHV